MLNITIIGPAYPYRGGISHHTNQLINALLELGSYRVSLFTFSKQYPSLLYPGKHQFEPEDTVNPIHASSQLNIFSSINTLNPISWYKTAIKIINIKPQYCVIKYWHSYFAPCFTFICWILRRNNIDVFCIIDNIVPHERHLGDLFLFKIFLSQIKGVITQSIIVHDQFKQYFGDKSETMILHPPYNQFGPIVDKKSACNRLGLPCNKKILLFFGFIRAYKGLDTLICALPYIIKQYTDVHLIVVGECFGDFNFYQSLINSHNLSPYITLYLQYIPNQDIPVYFGASDLLVLPYRKVTNSGIENIGHIYARDLLLAVGSDSELLAQKIVEKLGNPPQNFKKITALSWSQYVKGLTSFMQNF